MQLQSSQPHQALLPPSRITAATTTVAAATAASATAGANVAAPIHAAARESGRRGCEEARPLDTHGGRLARRSSHEDASGAASAPSSAAIQSALATISYPTLPTLHPRHARRRAAARHALAAARGRATASLHLPFPTIPPRQRKPA